MNDDITKSGHLTTTNGSKLFYTADGPAGAQWLVLSNSLATDNRMWLAQMDAFTTTHRVLRYDSRGHGQSGVTTDPYDFDDLADDVVQLMDHLDISQTDFVGVSMGGMTGLALALKAPSRVRRLVCCDARADAPDAYRTIWDGNIAKLHESGIEALCEPTIERWFTAPFRNDPDNQELLDSVRDMICDTPADGYEGAARCLQSLGLLPHLGDIKVSTLYVVGAQDPAAPVPVMQDMADRTPRSALAVLDDAAHLSNMEQPGAFNDRVLAFLNAL